MSSQEAVVAPALSRLQAQVAAAIGSSGPVPARCLVTGGTGFVGMRLVEMLVERGARHVVSFDIVTRCVPRLNFGGNLRHEQREPRA